MPEVVRVVTELVMTDLYPEVTVAVALVETRVTQQVAELRIQAEVAAVAEQVCGLVLAVLPHWEVLEL
jgi:hypothetical protein